MALKIQLRRDIAANWTANNPLLLNGEVGIETDTLKLKIGNGVNRWNSLPGYALSPGLPGGVATLNSSGKVPLEQLPDQISLDAEALAAIQNAISTITTSDITEGSNLYFQDSRAVNAVQGLFDAVGSSAAALNAAKSDATSKVNAALLSASSDATSKSNQALQMAMANAETYTVNAINALTTSEIEEGSRLYFTNERVNSIVGPAISDTIAYVDEALANFEAPSAIATTSDLPEGSRLYFTPARAITATSAKHNAALAYTTESVNDLRNELQNVYIPISEINALNGIAGLDSSGKIITSIIPSSIARTSDITNAVAELVNLAPASLNTLGELATAFQADQTGLSALVATVGTKLDTSIASTTYSTIDSPTFTGTVTIPAGASISGYATSLALNSGIAEAKAYTDTATNGINNSLGDYALIADRNAAGGYAGLDSNSQILESAIPSAITTLIASKANTNGTYSNGNSSSNLNKITYGTNLTPPSSGNSAGDIYIQY